MERRTPAPTFFSAFDTSLTLHIHPRVQSFPPTLLLPLFSILFPSEFDLIKIIRTPTGPSRISLNASNPEAAVGCATAAPGVLYLPRPPNCSLKERALG